MRMLRALSSHHPSNCPPARVSLLKSPRDRATRMGRGLQAALITTMSLLIVVIGSSAAQAETTGPAWAINSVSDPTNLAPESIARQQLVVTVANVGGASTDGSLVKITDVLPVGMTATQIQGQETYGGNGLQCSLTGLECTTTNGVLPGATLVIKIGVIVAGPPILSEGSSPPNEVSASGGGAAEMSVSSPVPISSTPAGFGITPGSLVVATSSSQAGSHPNLTLGFAMNTSSYARVSENFKDARFDAPQGFVGSAVGIPQCTAQLVQEDDHGCPLDTIVGIATVYASLGNEAAAEYNAPIFNIKPAPGEPVAFEFNLRGLIVVRLDASLLSAGDNRVRVTASDITEAAETVSTWITIWGVPVDHQGPGGLSAEARLFAPYYDLGGRLADATRVPLLTNSSQCQTPLDAGLSSDSWRNQGVFSTQQTQLGHATGCNLLSLSSSVSMLPDTLQAGAPGGYAFDLKVAQSNEPDGLVSPDVRKVVTALPVGTVISPSAADGLASCSDEQFYGSGPPEEAPAKPGECPRESQVGTVRIKTPALEEALVGDVYLADPLCHPCSPADAADGRMVRLFVQVVGEGESGIVVKLEGTGSIDQHTGQLTATFDNDPQVPFSEFKLTLGGGERATLANPRACGPATTNIDLTPWSTPFSADATPSSTFAVTGCYAPQFNPSFTGGSVNNQAGEFSAFTQVFGRSDADGFFQGLQVHLPEGLLGMLSRVSLCSEPQAAQGTCGADSLIGHVNVETGPGADPFLVTGGQVFITGPYKGAPYGLSIVVPAVAGPYTLSGTTGTGLVVVRAAISVDPSTSALTVTTDAFPTELDGIPLQLRLVNVTIDRPGFTFNPTNCSKLQLAATVTSTEGMAAPVTAPYQVTNCAALAFKPEFKVSTSGKTSRAKGASLDAKVIYPLGAKLANIAKVKVDLPKQLPSRLTTLQKACLAATFEANPANCPTPSVIGVVRASTPVLPVGLSGPVYFVSHGGAAFPDLVIVLQGDGVRVNLTASTFISHSGITSSTFKTVPDVPINNFELYLPEGPYSALAANGNLCTSKLVMPTAFNAQNGAEIHENTKISVTGCPKAKAAKKQKAKKAGRARKSNHVHGDRRSK
jgi:hypothetical protein